jgi:hypothetical protein
LRLWSGSTKQRERRMALAKGSRMAISIDLLRVFALLFGKVDGQDQLIDRLSHSRALTRRRIVYAPDYWSFAPAAIQSEIAF